MTTELKNIIIHPSTVITACSTVLFVGMYIMNNDSALENKIIELQVNQEVIYDTIETIKNNDLIHIDIKLDELLNSVHNLEIQLAKMQK